MDPTKHSNDKVLVLSGGSIKNDTDFFHNNWIKVWTALKSRA